MLFIVPSGHYGHSEGLVVSTHGQLQGIGNNELIKVSVFTGLY